MKTRIGTCGSCGGAVSVPTVFHSVIPPTPSCESCGRRPRNAFGPRLEMESDANLQPARQVDAWRRL